MCDFTEQWDMYVCTGLQTISMQRLEIPVLMFGHCKSQGKPQTRSLNYFHKRLIFFQDFLVISFMTLITSVVINV